MDAIQQHFLEAILPAIKKQVRRAFPRDREEAAQAVAAHAWKLYLEALGSGNDPAEFPSLFARRACLQVLSGRRVYGKAPEREATRLGRGGPAAIDELASGVSPADEAAFRIDYRQWRDRLPEKKGRIIDDLALGERTGDAAEAHGVSHGRVAQIRREALQDWSEYESTGRLR